MTMKLTCSAPSSLLRLSLIVCRRRNVGNLPSGARDRSGNHPLHQARTGRCLGSGVSRWGRIDRGNKADPHGLAASGDWEGARRAYLEAGLLPATATGYLRELRDFYTLACDCLWITFARGHLWWAFAEPEAIPADGATDVEGASDQLPASSPG